MSYGADRAGRLDDAQPDAYRWFSPRPGTPMDGGDAGARSACPPDGPRWSACLIPAR